jgi:hypothetical protein
VGRLRTHKLVFASLAIVALLSNLVAAIFCCTTALRTANADPDKLLGLLVICSEHTVAAPSDGKANDSDQPASSTVTHCPLCPGASPAVILFALAAVFALIPRPANRRLAFELTPTLADELRRTGLRSRAPPLHA